MGIFRCDRRSKAWFHLWHADMRRRDAASGILPDAILPNPKDRSLLRQVESGFRVGSLRKLMWSCPTGVLRVADCFR